MIGLVFAGIAVLGTEFGVYLNGGTMNVRNAAPLCAGLIFGAPAGLIAGIIGGVERYLAVYWGAGAFRQHRTKQRHVRRCLFRHLLLANSLTYLQ